MPTSATMRTRWVGTYSGVYGRARIYARHDSLIVALEGQELGPLQYQGGNTFVASWDHGTRLASAAGDVPVKGFTVSRRKRVLMYRRGGERTPARARRRRGTAWRGPPAPHPAP